MIFRCACNFSFYTIYLFTMPRIYILYTSIPMLFTFHFENILATKYLATTSFESF